MIVVIQCAGTKRTDAGHLVTAQGKCVGFVANPRTAPPHSDRSYARPDDLADSGKPWRQVLQQYNDEERDGNPLGLFPAYRLYENKIYGRLVKRFGVTHVYILSAGWGLIRADFLTPYYDITFKPGADDYKRRRKAERYNDFRMLPADTDQEIRFFGGMDYLPLFCSLTEAVRSRKIVYYNSATASQVGDCILKRFVTKTRTNWHYKCANDFLDGVIS